MPFRPKGGDSARHLRGATQNSEHSLHRAQARFEHRNDLGGAVSTLGRRNLLEVLSKGEEDLDPLGHGHLHRSVRVQMAKTVLIVNCRIIRNANLQATCDL
jgi:hypothetical protein